MRNFVYKIIQLVIPLWILIGITGPYSSLNANLLAIGVLFVFIFVPSFIVTALRFRKSLIYKQNAAKCTFFDVSHEQRPIRDKLHQFLPILDQLGFSRLGEIERKMPPESDLTWFIFGRTDGLIRAEIIAYPKIATATFITVFTDCAALETSFPIGFNLSLPEFRAVAVKADRGLVSAYRSHQRAVTEMMAQHGAPLAVNSIDGHLVWTEYTQQHHVMSILRIAYRRGILILARNIYLGLWVLLLGGLLVTFNGYQGSIGITMLVLMLPFIVMLFIPTRFID